MEEVGCWALDELLLLRAEFHLAGKRRLGLRRALLAWRTKVAATIPAPADKDIEEKVKVSAPTEREEAEAPAARHLTSHALLLSPREVTDVPYLSPRQSDHDEGAGNEEAGRGEASAAGAGEPFAAAASDGGRTEGAQEENEEEKDEPAAPSDGDGDGASESESESESGIWRESLRFVRDELSSEGVGSYVHATLARTLDAVRRAERAPDAEELLSRTRFDLQVPHSLRHSLPPLSFALTSSETRSLPEEDAK